MKYFFTISVTFIMEENIPIRTQIINKFIENIKESEIITDKVVKEIIRWRDEHRFADRNEIIKVLRESEKDDKTPEDRDK